LAEISIDFQAFLILEYSFVAIIPVSAFISRRPVLPIRLRTPKGKPWGSFHNRIADFLAG
jgi:hypothetical protein